MKKESFLAGVGGGIVFGMIQSLSVGVVGGALMGIFFGIGISVFLHALNDSKFLKGQVEFPDSVLLPDERVLLTKPANLVIEPKKFGLQRFAFDDLLWVVGMKNKESIGGAIHITNYRVVFKSHRFNRLRGMTSIFLPTVKHLENRSVLVFRKLSVATNSAEVLFVVGDVETVISQIESAQSQISDSTFEVLQDLVSNNPEKCIDALQSWDVLNKINNLLNFGKKASTAASTIANPLGAVGSIFMSDLLDQTLVEKCQHLYRNAEQHTAKRSRTRSAA